MAQRQDQEWQVRRVQGATDDTEKYEVVSKPMSSKEATRIKNHLNLSAIPAEVVHELIHTGLGRFSCTCQEWGMTQGWMTVNEVRRAHTAHAKGEVKVDA